MLTIPESSLSIPARAIESRPTRDSAAWLGHPLTVELYGPIDVVRLADRNPRSDARPGRPRDLLGDWFALGAATLAPGTFARAHALPQRGNQLAATPTDFAVWRLAPGSILNVGRCAPKFGMPGLGLQAEVIDLGRLPTLVRAGRAP